MADKASLKTRSVAPSSASSSSTSSAAAKARAKAEAAKARLSFAEKEMELKLEKARLEASMDLLSCKRETAAAVAEAEALENALDGNSEKHSSFKLSPDPTPMETAQRTKQYLIDQRKSQSTELLLHDVRDDIQTTKVDKDKSFNNPFYNLNPESKPFYPDQNLNVQYHAQSTPATNLPFKHGTPEADLDGYRYQATPAQIHRRHSDNVHPPTSRPAPLNHSELNMTDFVRYVTRRELVAAGLVQFNDKPQTYRAWKRSFENATVGLNLSPSEEMDLLLKWLGKESAEHIEQIRAIHINHPEAGLDMAWGRLEQRYGSAEALEDALFKRLDNFPKITNRDYSKLTKLSDLLMELQSAKDEGDLHGLSFLDTARGVNPIVQKLPFNLQEKWASIGASYKREHGVSFPPFSYFVNFVHQQDSVKNDPSFKFTSNTDTTQKLEKAAWKPNRQREVSVHKTEISPQTSSNSEEPSKTDGGDKLCPIHKKPHPLWKCRAFREKPIEERKAFLKENRVCFRCCASSTHIAKNCKFKAPCYECKSENHHTALHNGPAPWTKEKDPSSEHGGEDVPSTSNVSSNCTQVTSAPNVTTECTQVCGGEQAERSCSKICLVKVYPTGHRDKAVKAYVILDEQSNRSLACSQLFDIFQDKSPSAPYSLRTCAGVKEMIGRRASGYKVESLEGKISVPLPSLIECNEIPNNRDEIPTPNVALHHAHLRSIAHLIPELDPDAPILLLLGRDIIRVHKVRKQINGPHDLPYAQKLDLGWVVIGNVCLGNVHTPLTVSAFHTNIGDRERPTLFMPCPNVFNVKERYSDILISNHPSAYPEEKLTCETDHIGCTVFRQTKDDNQVAPSIQDISFLKTISDSLRKDANGSWVAPLPFQSPRQRLPNNRSQVLNRLMSLKRNLEKKSEMKEQFIVFMEKIFQNGHAELAPPLKEEEERWYLPIFGVYHPKKPNQIRVVFDSSAPYNGVSLNDVLLTGPDMNNTLLGVLLRYRKEAVAFSADIEQMFYSFLVREEDRNFLRFLWFQDNDLSKDIQEFRMKVHVFGNSPSPSVAIYGLHQSVLESELCADPDVRHFVTRNFYVDDGLTSVPTVDAAISLLKRTQTTLAKSNLRLHKIAANNKEVMEAFPPNDRATGLKDIDFDAESLPAQRSLGLNWDLQKDSFHFKVSDETKPYTRRGVLSTTNSLYDPLGFVAPITVHGKSILRELTTENGDWDTPLPQEMEVTWASWRSSLKDLSSLSIPRQYTQLSPSEAAKRELCVFSDASTKAIAAVAYLRVTDNDGTKQVGFVKAKAKLAPRPDHTIPRLELCAAVLAVELVDLISTEIDLQIDTTTFYTDSKVVLGYIANETRRFYVYVSNRVQRIRRSSHHDQWNFVPTEQNPADHATRFVSADRLVHTNWFTGPAFLYKSEESLLKNTYDLVDPQSDPDIRPVVSTLTTTAHLECLGSQRFSKFSSWKSLTRAMTTLLHVARSFSKTSKNSLCKGWHHCEPQHKMQDSHQAQNIIIQTVQDEVYADEIKCIRNQERLPKSSPIKSLDPFIDNHGLLRVGGRIHDSSLSHKEKNPLIIPGNHHIAALIIRHHHEQTHHQGRLYTEGAVRTAGFWVVGGKRKVSSLIYQCVICKRLRAPLTVQKMADLPQDRLTTDPPFTNVGLDVFGPWSVSSRQTRGRSTESKRWAVIFTCMSVRAVHIEVIESLDTSSFINALRRFLAVRGPVQHIRSDRGTNFIGACNTLKIPSNINETAVKSYLTEQGCSWTFNPPHASHFGGSWERMIGLARRILDSMFLQLKNNKLTHEVLVTFMSEVAAIINARPLVPVSTDPNDPFILTPAALLTQKVDILPAPAGEYGASDLFKQQWRQVQHLSNTFWDRWRKQFLPTLQARRKWQTSQPDVRTGTVVLLKDSQAPRNEWPFGLVTQVFPSKDGRVRKVEVKLTRQGGTKLFLRPISEIVLLLPPEAVKV